MQSLTTSIEKCQSMKFVMLSSKFNQFACMSIVIVIGGYMSSSLLRLGVGQW